MTVRSLALRQNPAYRPGDSRALMLFAFGGLLGVGCAAPVPRQPPATTASPVPVVSTVTPVRWAFRRSTTSSDYIIEQRSLVRVTTDSGSSEDSTSLAIEVALRHTSDGGAAGLIQSAVLGGPGGASAPYPEFTAPMAFVAPSVRRSVLPSPATRTPTGDLCRAGADAPLGMIRDLIIHIPDTVVVGTTWDDSGSYRICRGGAALVVGARRSFRVRGSSVTPEGGPLLVERSARFTVRGFASRADDTTHVEGSGASLMSYAVDPRTGDVISGTGSGSLDLLVRGRTRTERALQTFSSRVGVRRP